MSRTPSEADIAAAERVLGDLEAAWAKELPENVIAEARAMIQRLKSAGFQPPSAITVHPNALNTQAAISQAISQFNARIIGPNELRDMLVGPE